LRRQARHNVDLAAGWKADEQAHRMRRVGLRTRQARRERQRGGRELQKFSAWKFHGDSRQVRRDRRAWTRFGNTLQ
jgi:hypothetical protein